MQLFYEPSLEENSSEIVFGKDESRHISKVLRKQTGDLLNITNGKGWLFTSEITRTDHKSTVAKIVSAEYSPPLPYHLHLAVAPTKLNDRFEWFLEKATEIGVSEITPLLCEHSERKVIKLERYERIVRSAMKQSLKMWKPKLNPICNFEIFVREKNPDAIKCVAHCYDTERSSLKDTIVAGKPVILMIGPEGDFSADEVELAVQNEFKPVHLGSSRLRTETAAVVACHAVSFVNE